jgi:FtsZ-binding cell division protein ZapB
MNTKTLIVLPLLLLFAVLMLAIEIQELKEENKTIKQRAVAENAAVFKIDEKTQKEKLVWSSDLFEEFGVIK